MPDFPARVRVTELAGYGFAMVGTLPGFLPYTTTASAGDVNGDGFDDMLIGAPNAGGVVYLVYGKAGTYADPVVLGSLAPADGFLLWESDSHNISFAGESLDGGGDVNGDGYDDLVIGNYMHLAEETPFGFRFDSRAYVMHGRPDPSGPVDLSLLGGEDGVTFQLPYGTTDAAIAGDVNGDGYDDLIVSNQGHAVVTFGGPGGARHGGFLIDRNASSVSSAGDVNGDGFDDVLVGQWNSETYVIFGHAGPFVTINPRIMGPSEGFAVLNSGYTFGPGSFASAGDMNGDGLDDLIFGYPGIAGGTAFVVFGRSGAVAPVDLAALAPPDGFVIRGAARGDQAGTSVASAGDVNGDGFDDIVIGAPRNDDGGLYAGAAYIIFGKASGFEAIDLSALDPHDGFMIEGTPGPYGGYAGRSVHGAGDINGDGFDDILIGAPGMPDFGGAYLIYGRAPSEAVTRIGSVAGQTIRGGAFNDLLDGRGGADVLYGAAGADRLAGGAGHDIQYGEEGNDRLNGGVGNDWMDGGAGDDLLDGSFGLDTAVFASATVGVRVNLALAGAQDTVGAGFDNLRDIENLVGSAFADRLTGNAGANRLDGAAGADFMIGGVGDDIYLVDDAADFTIEAAGGGTDQVRSGVSHVLGVQVEQLTLTGAGAIDGTGNTLANILTGNGAANRLDGGYGADTMFGGGGDDIFIVDNPYDRAVEAADGGLDEVRSSTSFTLGGQVEALILTGLAAINGTGNSLANALTGNDAANSLNGGLGADTMTGGGDNDTYVVDHVLDRAIEAADAGIDRVLSSVSFTLEGNVENLGLTGTRSINGTGNALDNRLLGNGGANFLDGGAGADSMAGGFGHDIYVVDNLLDKAIETSAAGGIDLVRSSVSFALGTNVEHLILVGSAVINGAGNSLDNHLYGNDGANLLNGGAGADIMQGGLGSDTYVVDNVLDKAIETSPGGDPAMDGELAGGIDLVRSSVSFTLGANLENLILLGATAIDGTGNAGANVMTGNGAANRLSGLNGDDVIDGGGGNDQLHGGVGNDSLNGGTGADRFVFNTALNAGTNLDHILDLVHAIDEIHLDNAVFTTLAAGALNANAFVLGTAALDADDHILYDAATGALYYDRDGTGAAAAVQFATLDNVPASLNASDFLVI